MKKGEVWWSKQPMPIGRRPVVLLSRDESYSVRERAVVAQVTTRIRHIPAEVPLGPQDGLPKPCVINLDEIVTLPKNVLETRIAALSSLKLEAVHRALKFALDLE